MMSIRTPWSSHYTVTTNRLEKEGSNMSSSGVKVSAVTPPVYLGEGPHWCVREQALYYVDIPNQDVHRYHPQTEKHSKMHIDGGFVTLVVPHKDLSDVLIVSVGRSLMSATWPQPKNNISVNAKNLVTIASVDDKYPDNRFNDGKCDVLGRLWAGTMNSKTDVGQNLLDGSHYCLRNDGSINKILDQVAISNGLEWSADNKTFYFIDSDAYRVDAYTCDFATHALSDRRTIIDYKLVGLKPAFPDGMTIDEDGKLWVASYGAGKIHCINPVTGKIERWVDIPCSNVTSVCWGGPQFDHMYVTCTSKGLSEEQLAKQPQAGSVFRITGLGCHGRPSNECKVAIPKK
ncbi:unnamed protein product [Meganyctiphanes norvegica]|uniref:Regucalcin n=1 Tax=Meganyctiphanes norvegica TaxID=48144 RepID=A0AAV2RS15_MEGNR